MSKNGLGKGLGALLAAALEDVANEGDRINVRRSVHYAIEGLKQQVQEGEEWKKHLEECENCKAKNVANEEAYKRRLEFLDAAQEALTALEKLEAIGDAAMKAIDREEDDIKVEVVTINLGDLLKDKGGKH